MRTKPHRMQLLQPHQATFILHHMGILNKQIHNLVVRLLMTILAILPTQTPTAQLLTKNIELNYN